MKKNLSGAGFCDREQKQFGPLLAIMEQGELIQLNVNNKVIHHLSMKLTDNFYSHPMYTSDKIVVKHILVTHS